MKVVQSELRKTKSYMYKHTMKIQEVNRDEAFTMFLFIYNGYEEYHNYFNPAFGIKFKNYWNIIYTKGLLLANKNK